MQVDAGQDGLEVTDDGGDSPPIVLEDGPEDAPKGGGWLLFGAAAAFVAAMAVATLLSFAVTGDDDTEVAAGGGVATSAPPTSAAPVTAAPGDAVPATSAAPVTTAAAPTTAAPTTAAPTTAVPTTAVPTTAVPATAVPTTAVPTTAVPTTAVPTTAAPTTAAPDVVDVTGDPAALRETLVATDLRLVHYLGRVALEGTAPPAAAERLRAVATAMVGDERVDDRLVIDEAAPAPRLVPLVVVGIEVFADTGGVRALLAPFLADVAELLGNDASVGLVVVSFTAGDEPPEAADGRGAAVVADLVRRSVNPAQVSTLTDPSGLGPVGRPGPDVADPVDQRVEFVLDLGSA